MKKILEWLNGTFLGAIEGILDKVITTDKERDEAKLKIRSLVLNNALETDKLRADIIREEARGNFLQRSWRPILMLCFALIIVFGWFLYPLIRSFNNELPELPDVPVDMWDVVKIGVGGYIVGRSAEKIAPQIKLNSKKQE